MSETEKREPGTALAMSGGGFRATLFHLGALLRLNELGLLRRLTVITSVSGGSIASGYLGYRWNHLTFDDRGVATDLVPKVVEPLAYTVTPVGDESVRVLARAGSIIPQQPVACSSFGSTTCRPRFSP